MRKSVVVVGWALTLMGISGEILGVYLAFVHGGSRGGLVVLGVWFCSALIIVLGLGVISIGRRMVGKEWLRNPLG